MLGSFSIRSENLGMFRGEDNQRKPDILLTSPGRSPVVIECEFRAGANLERETLARLGERVEGEAREVEAAIAVAYPPGLREIPDARIAEAIS